MADNNIHETDRNTKTARATQVPCGKAARGRPRNLRNGSNGRGISKLCSSLEGCVQERRTTSTEKQTASVKAVQTVPKTARKAAKASFKGSQSKWLQNRLVDPATYCRVDTETFRRKLPCCARLADSAKAGLELPEARKTSKRTR